MNRKIWTVVSVILIVLAVSGCAFGGAQMSEPTEVYIEAPGAAPSFGEADMAMEYAAEEPRVDRAQVLADVTVERMVIRTADLDLIVPDTEMALEQIQELVEDQGGYVVSLNTYQYEQGIQGNVTLRVPAGSFDAVLEELKGIATTVRRESVSGQDVTEEFVDLESRLRHLEAVEEQLLEFLDEAEDTEAVLAVYEQLSYTQAEIEQVTGRMEYLQDQVAMATLSVGLTPDALAQPLEVGGWNLPGTVRNAVESLLNALEFIVKAAIYLIISVLPVLVILAIPVVGLILIIRALVRRRKRRRMANQ